MVLFLFQGFFFFLKNKMDTIPTCIKDFPLTDPAAFYKVLTVTTANYIRGTLP